MDLVNPADSLERQNEKLIHIAQALMRKVEQSPDQPSLAYAQFERAALLEEQVRQRTVDLERTLDLLHESNARFALARKEAEDARAYLADAIENIDEGFALFDDSDRLVMYNSRFCQALSDVRAQLRQGLGFASYVDLIANSAEPDWQAHESADAWSRSRRDLHGNAHIVFNLKLRGDRWIQVSEHRTDTRGTVIMQTDVTEIMRLERLERDKLVNQQELMLRATLDHLKQSVCIFDTDRRLVGWNRRMEQLLQRRIGKTFRGVTFDELLRRLDAQFEFTTGVDKAELRDWTVQTGVRGPLSFEVKRDDDTIFDVFTQELPDGGFVISFTDITQERRQSDALREFNETLERRVAARTTELGQALEDARRANASKTRFVAAASHDLLQPMSAAKLYASALEGRLDGDEDRALVRKTTSALESAETIIRALLDISKLDLGIATYDIVPVELARIFRTLSDEFAPLAKARGVSLRVVPTSLSVRSDPSYLYRILQNIISNAIRYTDGASILIGARRRGDRVEVQVLDRGPGISGEDQAVIFKEFRQLPRRAQSTEGLGLGLAIVDRACRMLGHDLHLTSQVGSGSCFSVGVERSTPVADLPAPAEYDAEVTHGLLVGLVENDAELANGMSLVMEQLGCDVLVSESAEDALALYEDLGVTPDCFLLDQQLGQGRTGTDLVPMLRKRFGPCPITIVSADRSPKLRDLCTALDVSLALKPLDKDEIERVLSKTRARN